jgi:hypothetical protein
METLRRAAVGAQADAFTHSAFSWVKLPLLQNHDAAVDQALGPTADTGCALSQLNPKRGK